MTGAGEPEHHGLRFDLSLMIDRMNARRPEGRLYGASRPDIFGPLAALW
jgi:hypothetical protein